MYGFYRIACAVPEVKVADVEFNTNEITKLVRKAERENAAVVVFPELSVTGYSCADLFHQSQLLDASRVAIKHICRFSEDLGVIIVVGAPIFHINRLYNCAVVIHAGEVLGIVPKSYLPNYKEYYEKRWFTPGHNTSDEVELNGDVVPFGDQIVFQADHDFTFGIEICEDLWNVIPPSSYHAMAGANVIFNLSASNELVSKAEFRRNLITCQSARSISAYCYVSAGVHESTTDVVYGGHCLVAENGSILNENKRFQRGSSIMYTEVDCQRLNYTRLSESSYDDNVANNYQIVHLRGVNKPSILNRTVDSHPFVPKNNAMRNERCEEIFAIQSAGLAKRLEHIGCQKTVVGISGGLDSTLALLVMVETYQLLDIPLENIVTVTMPGFGTTDRTYNNAVKLCKILGTDLREISIKAACEQHFKDIGHDPEVHDVTYENVQARERTQILMDIANKEGAIVIGTGDLSEIALGWSTYNGDHMSMYAVNCSVPKTLITSLVEWIANHRIADNENIAYQDILLDVIATPISPELLPPDEAGNIQQKTESTLGPYEVHDFFLYHTVKYGASPEKVCFLAMHAFKEKYSPEQITEWQQLFIKRFFSQQFKRSCIPDGPKVGTISLSPRGDWRMPSDASPSIWLN